MGQQQLLLVILVSIIIGIATLIGFNIFNAQAKKAHQDEIIQQMVLFMSQAKAHKIRPTALGGGGGTFMGFVPTGSDNFRGHIGNADDSPNDGSRLETGNVVYFFEWWPDGGYPQRAKIIASSKRFGEGNSWPNAKNARVVAYFDENGQVIYSSNPNRNGFMTDGDW